MTAPVPEQDELSDVLRDALAPDMSIRRYVSWEEVARAVLASDWLARVKREAAAEALREAADAWTQRDWSNVLLPKPTPPAVPVIAYANRVGDWLRARADHIEGATDA